jgi:hypothetical protein
MVDQCLGSELLNARNPPLRAVYTVPGTIHALTEWMDGMLKTSEMVLAPR